MYTLREEGCTLTNVYPPGGGGGIDQYPSGLAIYFSSYYNVNGITMARRYWRIPSSSFEVQAIPPPPSASPPEIRGIASTSQDSEGIRQYLLAMVMPLSQCVMEHLNSNSDKCPKLMNS